MPSFCKQTLGRFVGSYIKTVIIANNVIKFFCNLTQEFHSFHFVFPVVSEYLWGKCSKQIYNCIHLLKAFVHLFLCTKLICDHLAWDVVAFCWMTSIDNCIRGIWKTRCHAFLFWKLELPIFVSSAFLYWFHYNIWFVILVFDTEIYLEIFFHGLSVLEGSLFLIKSS